MCGFNNYLGINEEYDNVNKSMYFDNLEDVKQYSNEIICFYSDNGMMKTGNTVKRNR